MESLMAGDASGLGGLEAPTTIKPFPVQPQLKFYDGSHTDMSYEETGAHECSLCWISGTDLVETADFLKIVDSLGSSMFDPWTAQMQAYYDAVLRPKGYKPFPESETYGLKPITQKQLYVHYVHIVQRPSVVHAITLRTIGCMRDLLSRCGFNQNTATNEITPVTSAIALYLKMLQEERKCRQARADDGRYA